MRSRARHFNHRADAALRDTELQAALRQTRARFTEARTGAVATLPEFETLRRDGRDARERALSALDRHLERFESMVIAAGGHVHWAADATEAQRAAVGICHQAAARSVVKGKSMVTEEIGLNDALAEAGIDAVETDLGEYILQLAGEPPSHIIAPAVHKGRDEVADLFRRHHRYETGDRHTIADLVNEARRVLRRRFLEADVGITGANLLVAETGSVVLVTNEGNADLAATLPPVHVVIAGIDKIVAGTADAMTLLRLLARSATGQDATAYTSWFTGARRDGDTDGPGQLHVVLVDNGRSGWLGGPYHEMLHCIRCGACLNHCPVYSAIGGHAYGWVYPGPMGAVLTPLHVGLAESPDLPHASSLCGRCEAVCPVMIPLPRMLRSLRAETWQQGLTARRPRWALRLWARIARHPRLYSALARPALRLLAGLARQGGWLPRLPFAGGWQRGRALAAPEGTTFQAAWRRRRP